MTWQIADVKKPLASIGRMCDAGNVAVFTKGGGYVVPQKMLDKTLAALGGGATAARIARVIPQTETASRSSSPGARGRCPSPSPPAPSLKGSHVSGSVRADLFVHSKAHGRDAAPTSVYLASPGIAWHGSQLAAPVWSV